MDFRKIVLLRKKQDLSQRKMASILKVSKSTYARWETGEEIIPLKHFINLCNYFGVTMDYVLNLKEENNFFKFDYTRKIDKEVIGKNLKHIRQNNELTQRDLAKIFNTSQSTISAYESGKTLLLTIFAYQIAKCFKISLDSFCGLEKTKIEIK
ncbi:MAG: helix-turn-helix transcriptional regulator [Bacilli bacterium]|nr:helix-turn-helix transcriptional regulator [Bacilli bacterium]